MQKCVSGHLESFKTHLFLGEKRGLPLFFAIFSPNFMNFEDDLNCAVVCARKHENGLSLREVADRMGVRDPGNKPKSNDRIPYAYVDIIDYDIVFDRNNQYKSGKNKGKDRKKSILQGNRIEHPEYIEKNKLTIDYGFYITNQIMNPVKQVFDLEMDEKETELIFLK